MQESFHKGEEMISIEASTIVLFMTMVSIMVVVIKMERKLFK
jgi:hypothetical protein